MTGKPLNNNTINYLNIFLMLFSAMCSYLRPFETFLIVYAVLGPLHYLTEISWLHDRKYFTGRKMDALVLTVLCMLVTLVTFGIVPFATDSIATILIFYAFSVSLVFVAQKSQSSRLILITLLLPVSIFVSNFDWVNSVFNILLPTIIHVFIFTGLFILLGTLRSKNFSGYLSLMVFVACALGFFFFPQSGSYQISDRIKANYSDFEILNYYLMYPFSEHSLYKPANLEQYVNFVNNIMYSSPTAFAVMGFISFAYFYHYLNWFSKTRVIQWHKISASRMILICLVYVLSVVLYCIDYKLGLALLFFLSLLHVFLEFPLNHITFSNIFKELTGKRGDIKSS